MTQFPAFTGRINPFHLDPHDVHVWAVRLEEPTDAGFSGILTWDETARAQRFHFEKDARQFRAARAALRMLLGRYTALTPQEIRFVLGPQGKPAVAFETSAQSIHFNVSHSGELALIAIALQPLGVDLEYKRQVIDFEQMVRRFLSKQEYTALSELRPELREQAFFSGWTRKEAFLKAIGTGLSTPLDSFDVTLAPGEVPRILSIDGNHEAGAEWTLYHLEPLPGYIGAVAIVGHEYVFTCSLLTASHFQSPGGYFAKSFA
jgi:4'-phosphopantetheinyl transferase